MSRILIVEDEDVVTSVLADILEEAGHEVFTAYDGAEGLRILRDAAPTLVLLDLMLPLVDGRRFLEAKERDPVGARAAVVVMSSVPRSALGAHPVEAVLRKPFSLDALLAEVARHGAGRRAAVARP